MTGRELIRKSHYPELTVAQFDQLIARSSAVIFGAKSDETIEPFFGRSDRENLDGSPYGDHRDGRDL